MSNSDDPDDGGRRATRNNRKLEMVELAIAIAAAAIAVVTVWLIEVYILNRPLR